MATTREPKPVKQLRELLQEQQEPFILRKSFNAGSSFPRCHGNSRKSLKRSFSLCLKSSKIGIPHCPKVLRSIYNQVISFNERLRIKTSNHRDGNGDVTENKDRNTQEAGELDSFSSASTSTVFNSCSGSDADADAEESSISQQKDHISFTANTSQSFRLCNNEAVTDRKLQRQCIEDSKQHSPVSVLEEVASHRDEPEYFSTVREKNPTKTCAHSPKKVTEDSILSASLWKILFHSATEKSTLPGVSEIQELVHYNLSSQHLKSKSALQQTRQLLFDCVKEIVENQGRKEKQQGEYLEAEELGKLIGEKIKLWGKQSGEESTFGEQMEMEFRESAQEWSGYKAQRRKIGSIIGDAILEEISSEIVMDMVA